mmetsp:Transcript_16138/g.47036  ORF Transcript_16138/g.47036 Transcript_16138/m.47036 type:complete len:385 (-) Transcript_16138:51-1205(-)
MGARVCTVCSVCFGVVAVLVGYVLHDILSVFGEKELTFNDEDCHLIGAGMLKGGEDMALWRSGIAIVAAGDLKVLFSRGPAHTRLTGLFAVSMASKPLTGPPIVRPLTLVDFPKQHLPFGGHGLFLSNRTQRLYVVNHGANQSQVEVFGIEGQDFQDLVLRHLDSIQSSAFPLHGINDIVEGRSPNEVFVSVWRATSGIEEYNERQEQDELLSVLAYRLLGRSWRDLGVLRCALAGGSWACARSGAWGMPTANGLAISPDRGMLLVSCPLCADLRRYSIGEGGALTEAGPPIGLPYPCDNLEWDEETGRVLMGMIPIYRPSPARVPMELMALPARELSRDQPARPLSLLLHDGSKLSQCSAGLAFGASMLLGSPYHPGLLLCGA